LIEVINGQDIQIKNGRIQNESYPYDFHQFYEDDEKILILYLIIPGIKQDSVKIIIENTKFFLTAFFKKEYMRLYRAQQIEINGELPKPVLSGVFTSKYDEGILKITLVTEEGRINNEE
jgi:HSP20 family molecular chaperone IbpA